MDFNAVTQIISSVGFPIVMSLLFFFYVKDTQEEMTKTIQELKASVDRLYDMVERMAEERKKDEA